MADDSYASHRRESIKSPVGNVAGNKRRQHAVTVGKERRELLVRAKRLCRVGTSSDGDALLDSEMMIDEEQPILEGQTCSAVEDLKSAVTYQGKGALLKRVAALRELRRLLSRSEFPPVEAALGAGAMPLLVQCLSFGSPDEQLLEAAWCLTNIAAGKPEETKALLPALPLLVAHLGGENHTNELQNWDWSSLIELNLSSHLPSTILSSSNLILIPDSPSKTQPDQSPIVYPRHLLLPNDAIKVYGRKKNTDLPTRNQQSQETLLSQIESERLQDEAESSPKLGFDPELDLPIAQRKDARSCTQRPLQSYVSYANLSPKFQAFVTSLNNIKIPNYVNEVLKVPEWHKETLEEYTALEKNGTWMLTELPLGKKTVGCKWIFSVVKCTPRDMMEIIWKKSSLPVAEQCAWALGNVASEGEELRNVLLSQGALQALARMMLPNKGSTVRTAAWALSNLIKGREAKAATGLIRVDGVLDAIVRHLKKADDELATEVAWVVVYLSALSDVAAGMLVKSDVLQLLVERLATSNSLQLLIPVLRSLGNIIAVDSRTTHAVLVPEAKITDKVIEVLVKCLKSEHRVLKKEASWVLSNVAAGSLEHKKLIYSSEAVQLLLRLLSTAPFDIRKEAAYVLGNLCVAATNGDEKPNLILEHLIPLIGRGCLSGFLDLVRSADSEAARLGLQFTEMVLRGMPNGQGPKLVEQEDGIDAMERFQFHENEELRNMANNLVDIYFGEDYGFDE